MNRTYSDPDQVPVSWNIGDVILDRYEVRDIFSGGMGNVYRVFSREWQIELAVKTPHPELLANSEVKKLFEKECKTWIQLGLHPNIATCYFVSSFGGVLRVFSEFISDGSLSDCIKSGKLYANKNPDISMRRIFDISIQAARGLDYAHSRNVLHRDVKPDNILLSSNFSAHVTDFGLAGVQKPQLYEVSNEGHQQSSILYSSGGRTPAYNSPEQARGESVTRRTDIWSWAVSILEMLVGGVIWRDGCETPDILEKLIQGKLQNTPIPLHFLPKELISILSNCLTPEESKRPHDFTIISQSLEDIYKSVFSEPYPRPLPDQPNMDASSLNNKMLSLLELEHLIGPVEDNSYSIRSTLRESFPDFIIGQLNDALIKWRRESIPIHDLNRRIDNISLSQRAPELIEWQLLLELDKCDFKRAESCLNAIHKGTEAFNKCKEHYIARKNSVTHDLDEFLNLQTSFDTTFALQLLRKNFFQGADSDYYPYSFSGPDKTIVATITPDNDLVVVDFVKRLILFRVHLHQPSNFVGISEKANLVAVAGSYQSGEKNTTLKCYCLAVFSINDKRCLGTIVDEYVINHAKLEAITIDDHGQRVSLWWRYGNSIYEGVHDLDGDELIAYENDFRRDSNYQDFDKVIIDGSGKHFAFLLYGVPQCSIWRNDSLEPHRDSLINILDIDLNDFNLIDRSSDGYLPGLEPSFDFSKLLNHVRLYEFLKMAKKWAPSNYSHYIICRPSGLSFHIDREHKRKLIYEKAVVADQRGRNDEAIELYSKCVALSSDNPETILARRHELVALKGDMQLTRSWHQTSHHSYWSGNIFGLFLEADNQIVFQGYSFLGRLTPPLVGENYDKTDIRIKDDKIICVSYLPDARYLAYRKISSENPLICCLSNANPKQDSDSQIVWELPINPSRDRESKGPLRKMSVLDECLFVETHPGIISLVDLATGKAKIILQETEKTIHFIKNVYIDKTNYIFAALSPYGFAVFDSCGNKIERSFEALNHPDLMEISDASDDLSTVVGWLRSKRLAVISENSLSPLILWNPDSRTVDDFASQQEPYNARISRCGRAVAYIRWLTLQISCAMTGRTVLDWEYPPERSTGPLLFDASSRWLLCVHSDNHLEQFQLYWDNKRSKQIRSTL